ncbi:MAG: GNAT family N-acetyltransferase [Verrucomicrobia bacterium]|nr:GNAT family N-acetyltransferase [Verrucomicrobiota bacterium]
MNTITNRLDKESLWNYFTPSKGSSFSGMVTIIALLAISLLLLSCKQKRPPLTSFKVKEIAPTDKKTKKNLIKIVLQWKELAYLQSQNPDITTIDKKRLLASVVILTMLSTDLPCETYRVFTCLDAENETLQSIAAFESNNDILRLELLASNPRNLYPNTLAVKGAGSKLIHHLFQTCLQENKTSIKLSPSKSSVHFYRKLGFEELEDHYMQITSEKIKKIIKK